VISPPPLFTFSEIPVGFHGEGKRMGNNNLFLQSGAPCEQELPPLPLLKDILKNNSFFTWKQPIPQNPPPLTLVTKTNPPTKEVGFPGFLGTGKKAPFLLFHPNLWDLSPTGVRPCQPNEDRCFVPPMGLHPRPLLTPRHQKGLPTPLCGKGKF